MNAKGDAFSAALEDLRLGDFRGRDVILAWLERRGVPVRDREDLAQVVLLGALASWSRYDPVSYPAPAHRATRPRGTKPRMDDAHGVPRQRTPRESLRRWLHGITNHVVAGYLRDRSRQVEEPCADPIAADIADDHAAAPDSGLERRATRAELSAAVFLLPALSRVATMSRIKPLALRTGRPISTLYKVRERAYATLAGILDMDPIGLWRAQAAAQEMARRALCSRGLPDREARALVRIAVGRSAVKAAKVWRRARKLGLLSCAAGPLALAALAAREAAGAVGQRARDLVQLAIDAVTVGVACLRRAYAGRLPTD